MGRFAKAFLHADNASSWSWVPHSCFL